MNINNIDTYLQENGIIPIEVGIMHAEEYDNDVFFFLGEFEELIAKLKQLEIKSIFLHRKKVNEEDFVHYLDEEEVDLLKGHHNFEIDEDGGINLEAINPDLGKYRKYIGLLREIEAVAMINGKEVTSFFAEDWNRDLSRENRLAINVIDEAIENRLANKEHPRHRHKS